MNNCEDKLKEEVVHLFDFLLFETSRQEKHELLVYWMHTIRETLKQMESAYQIRFDGNTVYALSYYLYQRSTVKWLPDEEEILQLMKGLSQQLELLYPANYQYATRILELTHSKLDLDSTLLDKNNFNDLSETDRNGQRAKHPQSDHSRTRVCNSQQYGECRESFIKDKIYLNHLTCH